MKEITPLKRLLEDGLEQRKKALLANLETIRWDISSPNTLHAVTGNQEIENVSGHKLLPDMPLRGPLIYSVS